MSNQPPKPRTQVPDSLRDVLLDFSIAYLLEQPGDVVDYAVEFFTKLQSNRRQLPMVSVVIDGPPSPDESVMSLDEGIYFENHNIINLQIQIMQIARIILNSPVVCCCSLLQCELIASIYAVMLHCCLISLFQLCICFAMKSNIVEWKCFFSLSGNIATSKTSIELFESLCR